MQENILYEHIGRLYTQLIIANSQTAQLEELVKKQNITLREKDKLLELANQKQVEVFPTDGKEDGPSE